MKKKVVALGCLGVALVLLGVLGVGGYWGYKTVVRPTMAYTKAMQMMNEFTSAEYEMVTSQNMKIEDLGLSVDMDMDGTGQIDLENKEMSMDATVSMMGQEIQMKEVIAGNDVYLKVDGEDWMKVSVEEMEVNSGFSMEQFTDNQIWANSINADMTYVGTETVDGVECYAYELTVSNQLKEKLETGLIEGLVSSGIVVEEEDINLSDMEVKTWARVDTQMPYRENLTITGLTIDTANTQEDIGKIQIDMQIDTKYFNVNEPVSIEVPSL